MMLVAPRRPAYRLLLICLALCGANAHALGLGSIALQSGLGRPLQASIPVYGLAADDTGSNCLKTRLLALDGSLLARPLAELTGSGAAALLTIRTVVSVNEPVVNVSVEIGCTNSVKREYQILLDPVPATAQQPAPVLPAARPVRAERNALPPSPALEPQHPSITPTTAAAPASTTVKRPAPARPKPAAAPKSVLTLTAGDAEIEQVRANLALRYATTLSEPRLETDPARLAEMRADQARVAALLRGENPLAYAQAQTRELQARLQAAQQTAAEATRRIEQEKATMAAAQDQTVSSKLVAVLVALLVACIAAIGWLLWSRAEDRRRQEQAFFTMDTESDASAAPARPVAAPTEPVFEPAHELPVVQFTSTPLETLPSAAATHDWGTDPITLPVATSPPEQIDIPESWLLIENRIEEMRVQPSENAWLALDGKAQAHAADVASMLLAAEDWMAEHNPLRAAELLRPYLEREDMRSPAPGLYLLSLYRTTDDQVQIQSVEAHLKQHFPAEAANWRDTTQPRRSIADFPVVHAAVDSLSETDKLLPYLNSLLLAPEQFDFSTYREIVRAIRLVTETKQQSEMHAMSLDFQ
jgi:pilus assembly protein FimV